MARPLELAVCHLLTYLLLFMACGEMGRKILVQGLAGPFPDCEAPRFISANFRGFLYTMMLLLISKQNTSIQNSIKPHSSFLGYKKILSIGHTALYDVAKIVRSNCSDFIHSNNPDTEDDPYGINPDNTN